MPSTPARARHAIFGLVLALSLAGATSPAWAIPAFARKYQTSCLTCHTIYPKLTPFGEAFRRNGYRFPGIDSDFVKQPTVPLGQDAYKKTFPNSVWPGSLPGIPALALGFNGQAIIHPDTKSGGGAADGGSAFSTANLAAEGHIWAGGDFDDSMTFFGEITFADGAAELEKAWVTFADLIGPDHAVQLQVGKTTPTLTSFGGHSSYIADAGMTPLFMTALYGGTTDAWNVTDNYQGLELNGVICGRLNYSLGLNAGAQASPRTSQDVYAHVGYKLGGMALDGEGAQPGADSTRPWAETSLTIDAFGYRAKSQFGDSAMATHDDVALVAGGGIRAQWDSLEFDAGGYVEKHDHAQANDAGVTGIAQWDELSYIVFPWLVPAVRVDYIHLSPSGGASVYDLRITPGVAALVRPNLKLTLLGQLELAQGAPDGGWGAAGGFAAPAAPDQSVSLEVESIVLGMAYAY